MSQVLLFTSPYFRGTISDTPSGTAYHVKPGDTIAVDERDVPFLLGYGFAPAAPPAVESTGDVVGPAGATSGHLAVFSGATGKLISDGGAVPSSAAASPNMVGIGNDGTLVASSGTTTLARDMNYTNVTLSGSAVVNTAGFRLFWNGTLDLSAAGAGAIICIPAVANAGTVGVGGTGTTTSTTTFSTIGNGVAGANGGITTNGTIGVSGISSANRPMGGNGGASGAGGDGSAHTGGAAGVGGILSDQFNSASVADMLAGRFQGGITGAGGGGGGGDATLTGGGGGAGGLPGSSLGLFGNILARGTNATAGIISCHGGIGGKGANGAGGTLGTGGGGGGGGGGAGGVVIITQQRTGSPITNGISAVGGTGGAGGNGVGTAGVGGAGGTGGTSGSIQQIDIATATYTATAVGSIAGTAGTAGGAAPNGAGGPGGAGGVIQANL